LHRLFPWISTQWWASKILSASTLFNFYIVNVLHHFFSFFFKIKSLNDHHFQCSPSLLLPTLPLHFFFLPYLQHSYNCHLQANCTWCSWLHSLTTFLARCKEGLQIWKFKKTTQYQNQVGMKFIKLLNASSWASMTKIMLVCSKW